jgi:hypothetical protein
MPVEVILNELPAGIATKATRQGETVPVRITGFFSSEDGQDLITHLEQLPSILLAKAVGNKIPPSQVDNLLAIIRRDRTATVYVNELYPQLITKVGRDVERGQPVFKDDIVDISRADIGVDVPPEAAVVFLFSWGWRKGVFFDFGPVGPDAKPRAFDLPSVLGELHARLMFQERFSISEDEWARLFKAGWFPFVGLGNPTIKLMLTHLRADWDIDKLIPKVLEEVRAKAHSFLRSWKLHPALATHASSLEEAIGHFLSGNHASCSKLLFPVIEGIHSAVSAHEGRAGSLLMPHRFEGYMRDAYLPLFNPEGPHAKAPDSGATQGEGGSAGWDAKSSAIALLVVHQLFHSFELTGQEQGTGAHSKEDNTSPRKVAIKTGPPTKGDKESPRRVAIEAVEAANRWSQWWAKGQPELLAQVFDRLDGNLPGGWKRLQGEELERFGSFARPGSAWYSLPTTSEYVGVALSLERP